MAKLAILTVTVFITLFFTISASKPQRPLDLLDDDSASFHDPSITLPEPDIKPTIVLPSDQKPESDPLTMVELEHNEKEIEPRDLDPHRHHRCHHAHRRPDHHRQHHQIWFRQFVERPEVENWELAKTERSYENDMLVADPEMEKGFEQWEGNLENDMLVADPEMEKGFDDGALDQDLTEIHIGDFGGRHHAPSRWVGFHFGGRPKFPDDKEHEHEPHHHHRHDDEDDEYLPDDEDHREDHRDEDDRRHHHDEKRPFGGRLEENGGGLLKRFRKFLHQIDF